MDYAKVLRLPQYFRNIQRLTEILRVLVKHGFGDLVQRLNLGAYIESGLKLVYPALPERERNLSFGARLRLSFEELGPTFIKFGQIIAARPDIFPIAVIQELKKLQDRVPPFPASEAKRLVAEELGKSITDLFHSFSDIPVAAASIAQVHRAILKDGTEVVIKVQRPNLDRVLATDIEILMGLAALVEENLPESRVYSPREIVNEFTRSLKKECDFRREARNMQQFAANFAEEPGLIVPKVYSEYTTRLVLTEEYIKGIKADDMEAIDRLSIDRKRVVETINRVLLESVFEHRFFHADPHPGNLIITEDSRIALLDYGMMGRLDKTRLDQVLQFLVALLSRDLDRMLRVLHETKIAPLSLDDMSLKSQVAEIIDQYMTQSLERLDLGELLSEIFELVKRYGVHPPADLLLVAKSITMLISIGTQLDPDFVPVESIRPYLLERYISHLTDPKLYATYLTEVLDSYRRLFTDLPNELRLIMRSLSRGELTLRHETSDLDRIRRHQNRLVNRALTCLIGLTLLTLGTAMTAWSSGKVNVTVSYLLIIGGSLILLMTWRALGKSDGTH